MRLAPPTALPRARRDPQNHLWPNRTAICPQSDSDSGQLQYDLKEAEEEDEGGGREGDARRLIRLRNVNGTLGGAREADLRRASNVASSVCVTYLRECEARVSSVESRLNPKLNLNPNVNVGVEALREFGF